MKISYRALLEQYIPPPQDFVGDYSYLVPTEVDNLDDLIDLVHPGPRHGNYSYATTMPSIPIGAFLPGYGRRTSKKFGRGKTRRRGGRATKRTSQVLRNARAIANIRTGGFMGLELKFLDTGRKDKTILAATDWIGTSVDPATELCLNSVGQGTSESQRLGRHFKMKSLYVTGQVTLPANSSVLPTVDKDVMIAIVLDTQTNLTAIVPNNIYKNPIASDHTNAAPLRVLDETDRYKVLKKKVMTFRPGMSSIGVINATTDVVTVSHGRLVKKFAFYIDLKGMSVMMKGTDASATVADIQDNSIHILANATGTGLQMNYNCRLRFTTT